MLAVGDGWKPLRFDVQFMPIAQSDTGGLRFGLETASNEPEGLFVPSKPVATPASLQVAREHRRLRERRRSAPRRTDDRTVD